MKLLHWITVVNTWWTEYKVWTTPAAVRCDYSFSQRISSASFHTSSWYSPLSDTFKQKPKSVKPYLLKLQHSVWCILLWLDTQESDYGAFNHYCGTSSQVCIITMVWPPKKECYISSPNYFLPTSFLSQAWDTYGCPLKQCNKKVKAFLGFFFAFFWEVGELSLLTRAPKQHQKGYQGEDDNA